LEAAFGLLLVVKRFSKVLKKIPDCCVQRKRTWHKF